MEQLVSTKFYQVPRNLISDKDGYEFISSINIDTWNISNGLIFFDFSSNFWFDANLCSPFGGLIENLEERSNHVIFFELNEDVERLFRLNGFYKHIEGDFFDLSSIINKVDYRRFSLDESGLFQDYIQEKLFKHHDFPSLSDQLSNKINKSILEIFNNAIQHGKCKYVYTCGQYYRRSARLKFTMADMGKTIRKNVNEFFKAGNQISGKDAIEWAVEKGHTTKVGPIPGGLGFALIRDFLKLNDGCIQVISSDGFWEEKDGKINSVNLESRFLGTIVNLEFNLNDKKSYILASEIDPESIF